MKENFDKLKIGNKFFNSRLMLGTGKYKTTNDAINSIESSECEIVTVAIRRLPMNLKNDNTSFLSNLNWKNFGYYLIQLDLKQQKKLFEWLF
jgi:thiazole synthase